VERPRPRDGKSCERWKVKKKKKKKRVHRRMSQSVSSDGWSSTKKNSEPGIRKNPLHYRARDLDLRIHGGEKNPWLDQGRRAGQGDRKGRGILLCHEPRKRKKTARSRSSVSNGTEKRKKTRAPPDTHKGKKSGRVMPAPRGTNRRKKKGPPSNAEKGARGRAATSEARKEKKKVDVYPP